jgi:hypothetical protein
MDAHNVCREIISADSWDAVEEMRDGVLGNRVHFRMRFPEMMGSGNYENDEFSVLHLIWKTRLAP